MDPDSAQSTNGTNATSPYTVYREADIRASSIAVFVAECALVTTNILSIAVFCKGPRSRTDISPLLVNLCVSDLTTLIWLPMVILAIVEEVSFQRLPYCVLMYVGQIASILTHLVISGHRFVAIKFPFLVHRLTAGYVAAAVTVVWLLAVSCAVAGWSAGICYDDELVPVPGRIFRNISIFVTLTFIAPVFCCCLLYSLTGCELWGRKIIGIGTSARRQLARKKKVIKMLIVMVLMFILSWLPWTTLLLYDAYSGTASDAIVGAAFVLAISNSFQNPLLYLILHDNYRRDVKDLVCCRTQPPDATSLHVVPTLSSLSAAERRQAYRSASWNVSVESAASAEAEPSDSAPSVKQ